MNSKAVALTETTTPTGVPGYRIVCDCKVCRGQAATVRAIVADTNTLTATHVHNLVRLAHAPLARAASSREFGPWAA